MAIQTVQYLKDLFVNGYIPVTQDYTDLIDTLHSLENTGIFTDNGDGTYTFDDGSGSSFTIDSNVDLSNYVTLDTDQTITGEKTFDNDVNIPGHRLDLSDGNIYLRRDIVVDEIPELDIVQIFPSAINVKQGDGRYSVIIEKEGIIFSSVASNTHINEGNIKVNLGVGIDTVVLSDGEEYDILLPQKNGTIALLEDMILTESTSENIGIGFVDFETDDTGEKLQVNGLIRSNVTVAEQEIADDEITITKAYLESVLNPIRIFVDDADFGGTFESFSASYTSTLRLHYYKVGNKVFLKGTVKGGASGEVLFTMPSGYEPLNNEITYGVASDASLVRFSVSTTGNVTANSATGLSFTVIDMSFLTSN